MAGTGREDERKRISKHALSWVTGEGKKRRERQRMSLKLKATVDNDLKLMGMKWEDMTLTTKVRVAWRNSITLYVKRMRMD